MAINSDVQLCNLALGHMGDFGTIESIDTPSEANELIFAKWYDITRQTWLKKVMPNFCVDRATVAANAESDKSDFTNSYPHPSNSLKILGIGQIQDKVNDYTVEGENIYTNRDYSGGLPVRFIKDVTDISKWSPEAIIGFSWFLAEMTAMEVTQNAGIFEAMAAKAKQEMVFVSGVNAQENRPIRISNSRYRQARQSGFPTNYSKK